MHTNTQREGEKDIQTEERHIKYRHIHRHAQAEMNRHAQKHSERDTPIKKYVFKIFPI